VFFSHPRSFLCPLVFFSNSFGLAKSVSVFFLWYFFYEYVGIFPSRFWNFVLPRDYSQLLAVPFLPYVSPFFCKKLLFPSFLLRVLFFPRVFHLCESEPPIWSLVWERSSVSLPPFPQRVKNAPQIPIPLNVDWPHSPPKMSPPKACRPPSGTVERSFLVF